MNTKTKIAVVAPVHIQVTKKWIDALKKATKGIASVIIVDDSNGKVNLPKEWDVYGYDRQREELGDELYEKFEVFHKSSACRNFGHWLAYKKGFDIIITLDSDCVVPKDFVEKHVYALEATGYGWVNPIEDVGWFPRGFPYFERERKIACNIGLWENELDLGGQDRVQRDSSGPKDPKVKKQKVAHGFIPHCGMNTSFWAHSMPAMLFIPNFDDGTERFRRHDDIWGGYIYQNIIKLHDEMIAYGFPIVCHDSNLKPVEDMQDEQAMLHWEESFYSIVDTCIRRTADQTGKSFGYKATMEKFVEEFKRVTDETLFSKITPALEWWVKLYE